VQRTIAFVVVTLLLTGVVHAAAEPGPLESTLRSEIRRLPAPDRQETSAPAPAGAPSPRKAFLFSLALPGLGQLYGSGWDLTSWTTARAVAYGSFETYAWMRQQDNHGRGLDQQTEYRLFALENWRWAEHCADWNGGDGAVSNDPFILETHLDDDWYIDTEPEWLEWYEDIHKLQKWICGWDDYQTDRFYASASDSLNDLWQTPLQREYRAMRQAQNELMSTADHWIWAIVANHLVSAFDAYFTAKRWDDGEVALSRLPAVRFGETIAGRGGTVALAWTF